MGRQNFTTARDGCTERVASSSRLDARRQISNDFVPGARLDFQIDAAVGQDFDTVFQQRNENQNTRVITSIMQTVLGESSETSIVNRLGDAVYSRKPAFDSRDPAEKKAQSGADDGPKIEEVRSPRIAPQPFGDHSDKETGNNAEQFYFGVPVARGNDHGHDFAGGLGFCGDDRLANTFLLGFGKAELTEDQFARLLEGEN